MMFTMEALIVLALLGIVGIISSRRWRYRVIAPMTVLVFITLMIMSPLGIALMTWGLVFPLPPDLGEPVAAIVILGRGEDLRPLRVEVVQKQWQAKRATKIFASGMMDATEIMEQLKDNGVPQQVMSGETCSRSTEENAIFTSAILNSQKNQRILLVTDQPHMLRSLLTFQSFGFTVVPHPSLLPSQWSSRKRIFLIVREYMGLAHYALVGRFKPRPLEQLKQPPTEIMDKLATWKCHIQKT